MIKQVKEEDTPFRKANSKLNLFYKDIKEIIDNRIKYSEFIDFYYANSTPVADLNYKAQHCCRNILYKETGKWLTETDFFTFSKSIKNGTTRFFAYFDIEKWESTLENYQDKEG